MNSFEFDYDALVRELEKCNSEPSWVVARSTEDAQAFAQWCVDSGFERPLIRPYTIPADA